MPFFHGMFFQQHQLRTKRRRKKQSHECQQVEERLDHTRFWPAYSRSHAQQNQQPHIPVINSKVRTLCWEDWCCQEMRYRNLRNLKSETHIIKKLTTLTTPSKNTKREQTRSAKKEKGTHCSNNESRECSEDDPSVTRDKVPHFPERAPHGHRLRHHLNVDVAGELPPPSAGENRR